MGKKKAESTPKASASSAAADDAALDEALKEAGAARGAAKEASAAGDACALQGDWSGAAGHFTEAIDADPNSGAYRAKRAVAHAQCGRAADALVDARAAAGLGGSDGPRATEAKHKCYERYTAFFEHCRDGKVQAAVESFEKASMSANAAGLTLGPGDIDVQELRTLPAPEQVLGKGFEVVNLKVGVFPLRFLICTAFTNEAVITPNTCHVLDNKAELDQKDSHTVDIPDAKFEGGQAVGELKDVKVTNFSQAQLAKQALRTTIHGMFGVPFLQKYDLDLDRESNLQRLMRPGSLAAAASGGRGAIHCPGIPLPGSLVGIPVVVRAPTKKSMVMLGIISTGSMFSVMNWKAAEELQIASGPDDPVFEYAFKVAGATKKGVGQMPIVGLKISFCPDGDKVGCRTAGISKEEFESTGKGKGWQTDFKRISGKPCAEFGRVNAGLGDALEFEYLGDSAVGGFKGPAVMIGQDVLAQASRLSISVSDRQLWLDPPGEIVDADPF